jgi:hypothetical protein
MNSPLLQDFPASRWDVMCRRLEPLLGDVKAALGPRWHERAEAFFNEADFQVADAILGGLGDVPDWFVIRYTRAGQHLDAEGDTVSCAPSWSDALAVLLGACESKRSLPSHVECDGTARTLRIFVGEELLATVMPLPVTYLSPELRKRALSTICGLRKSADANAELRKRARRWPGMSALVAGESRADHEMQEFRERMAHHPIPREWLQSARMLCAACSMDNPSTSTVQAVAAAALGAKTWNHLAGPHGDFSARLLQPWYVSKDDEICAFHADAIDAFADLFTRGPRLWTAGWAGVALDSGCSITAPDYVPKYTFIELSQNTPGTVTDGLQVGVYPVSRSAPEAKVLARVADVTPADTDAIAALFGIGLPIDVKARMLDERSQETLIVQDGLWRFTRAGDPLDQGTSICVHRVGSDGNSVWSAAVPAYKGLLQIHRATGFYVFCADYDGAHPVAVIDGLSPVAAAQVRSNLGDTTEDRLEFREELRRPRDRQDFQKLLEKALWRRSVV